MNTKVQHLLRHMAGVSGMKLLRAIAKGEQNPQTLLSLIDVSSLKASEEELCQSLKGIYKKQHTIVLERSLVVR